jgi:hypothetical protein
MKHAPLSSVPRLRKSRPLHHRGQHSTPSIASTKRTGPQAQDKGLVCARRHITELPCELSYRPNHFGRTVTIAKAMMSIDFFTMLLFALSCAFIGWAALYLSSKIR